MAALRSVSVLEHHKSSMTPSGRLLTSAGREEGPRHLSRSGGLGLRVPPPVQTHGRYAAAGQSSLLRSVSLHGGIVIKREMSLGADNVSQEFSSTSWSLTKQHFHSLMCSFEFQT